MNRKILVLLVLIGLFAVIGVSAYAYVAGAFSDSETTSEVSSEVTSEQSSEVSSEITKDPNEGVDTEVSGVTDSEAETDGNLEGDPSAKYDENGDLREDSKYLDDDQDTIANYYDICPGVDDFTDECETDAYDKTDDSVADENTDEDAADDVTTKYDENGDLRENSKYLDDDGDTIANFYDVCPGVDDFSGECDTDVYNK